MTAIENTTASNQAVLKALGLEGEKQAIAVNIKLRINEVPRVAILRHLPGFEGSEVQRFRLVPECLDVPAAGVWPGVSGAALGWAGGWVGPAYMKTKNPEPFDLDRACAEARARLHAGIDESVRKAMYDWAIACCVRVIEEAFEGCFEKAKA